MYRFKKKKFTKSIITIKKLLVIFLNYFKQFKHFSARCCNKSDRSKKKKPMFVLSRIRVVSTKRVFYIAKSFAVKETKLVSVLSNSENKE